MMPSAKGTKIEIYLPSSLSISFLLRSDILIERHTRPSSIGLGHGSVDWAMWSALRSQGDHETCKSFHADFGASAVFEATTA